MPRRMKGKRNKMAAWRREANGRPVESIWNILHGKGRVRLRGEPRKPGWFLQRVFDGLDAKAKKETGAI